MEVEVEDMYSVGGAEAVDFSLEVGVTREEEVEVVVAVIREEVEEVEEEEEEEADARIIISRSFANLGAHEYHSICGDSGYAIESNKPRHHS